MVINREAYERGFVSAIAHVKQAMVEGVTEQGQKGVDSNTNGPDAALKTVKPFGKEPNSGKGNLADITMKDGGQGQGNGDRGDDRFSHGPGSTTSGSGTDNY